MRLREAFIRRVAPTEASWRPLVASGARTAAHVASPLEAAWQALMGNAFQWEGREPGQRLATLWLLLLPSFVLHVPSRPTVDGAPAPLSLTARAAALLDGDFLAALGDCNAGVWRPGVHAARRAGDRRAPDVRVSQRRTATARLTPAQRRALRQAAAGRLSAAALSLLAEPLAPQTWAMWLKALALFPCSSPDLATTASVEEEFEAELKEAEAFGAKASTPKSVTREGVAAAIRSAPRGKAPGPSGLRVEHLWALDAGGRGALVGVVVLLAGPGSARLPACAAAAHAGTDMMLLRRPGGVGADGLPGLRPIGMPEILRKLEGSALSAAVRAAAAEFFAPVQLGVGVSSPCERILKEVCAHMASHPDHAVVELDFRNAFNLVSLSAAAAVLGAALPITSPYMQSMYGGAEGRAAPCVYGWADNSPGGWRDDEDAAAATAGDGSDGAAGSGSAADAAAAGPLGREEGGVEAGGPAASGSARLRGGGERVGGDGGLPEPPPPRLFLRAERGDHQGGPLGSLLHAAALWPALRRLAVENPRLLVLAFHDDVVVVGAPADMRSLLLDAARLGRAVDAELAPVKCVGWCPSGAPPPPGWTAPWVTEGVTQFSVLLGSHSFVRAGVEGLVVEQRRLTDAIAALPPAALQMQLSLLRLCAGPRDNYLLRALPLEAAAQLAAAVDGDASAVLKGLLTDASDDPAVVAALLERAALPPAMGGMGIGGRARVVMAAVLASWTDALRARAKHSPALRALGAWLRARGEAAGAAVADVAASTAVGADPTSALPPEGPTPGGGGAPVAPRAGTSTRLSVASGPAPAARRGVSGVGSRTAHPPLGVSPNPRGRRRPRVTAHGPTTGCAGLAAAGFSFAAGRHILDAPRPPTDVTPPGAATPAAVARVPRRPAALPVPPPSASGAPGSTWLSPVVWQGPDGVRFVRARPSHNPPPPAPITPLPPPPPPPQPARALTPEEVALRGDLLTLCDAVASSFVAPASGVLWVPPRRPGRAAQRPAGPLDPFVDLSAGGLPAPSLL